MAERDPEKLAAMQKEAKKMMAEDAARSDPYLSAVERLFGRKLESGTLEKTGDFAPLPHITVRNVIDPQRILPGDLSTATDMAIFAEVQRLLGGITLDSWGSLDEDARIPLIESAITARDAEGDKEDVTKWSAPAKTMAWCERFHTSDRTLRQWRKAGTLRMERVIGQRGMWKVDESDPLYAEWNKNRTSIG